MSNSLVFTLMAGFSSGGAATVASKNLTVGIFVALAVFSSIAALLAGITTRK